MPSWNDIVLSVQNNGSKLDKQKLWETRQNYIKELSDHTGRNTIAYYSGFLTSNIQTRRSSIIDEDMNGFMNAVYGMDRKKGLDLILHTPGGEVCATEAIGTYLISMFGDNIRVIVPQLAMSGGTMLCCLGTDIVMGKHSSIGPIDPQLGGVPAHGVKIEFENIKKEVAENPKLIYVYKEILAKYHPTFILSCLQAISLSKQMAKKWLKNAMFKSTSDKKKIDKIVNTLNATNQTLHHARHYGIEEAKKLGLKIIDLESDQTLQDKVLSIHHSFMYTFSVNPHIVKIIENDQKKSYIFNQIQQPVIMR